MSLKTMSRSGTKRTDNNVLPLKASFSFQINYFAFQFFWPHEFPYKDIENSSMKDILSIYMKLIHCKMQ